MLEQDSEPFLEIVINGKQTQCLVRTGATKSLLNASEFSLPTSDQQVTIVGVNNAIHTVPLTETVPDSIGNRLTHHSFVL